MSYKDAYYFPHDSNAKDDPKIVLLIDQMQLEGYGIYWVLIETLRDQPQYRYPLALISALARKYNTTAEKMKAVICGYGLFEIDEDNFFSVSLLRRMSVVDDKRAKAKIAADIKWEKWREEQRKKRIPFQKNIGISTSDADALPMHCDSNARKEKVKEKKEELSSLCDDDNSSSPKYQLTLEEKEKIFKALK